MQKPDASDDAVTVDAKQTELLKKTLANSRWKVGKIYFQLKPDGSLGGVWKRLRHSYWVVTGADSISLIDNQETGEFLRIKLHEGYQRGDASWKDGTKRTAFRR